MVMKRFEIIEKLYLSKALLKMAGGGDASPTSPPGSAPALGYFGFTFAAPKNKNRKPWSILQKKGAFRNRADLFS